MYSLEPLSRKYIFVNAQTGEVEKEISRIRDSNSKGKAHTLHSGQREVTCDSLYNLYRMYENRNGVVIHTRNMNSATNYIWAVVLTDGDNVWDSTHNYFNSSYDAHFRAEITVDYFKSNFNRNSFDNKGGAINSYVNYGC